MLLRATRQDEEIEKIKELCEKNQQLLQENDMYKQKLALLHVASGKKLHNILPAAVICSPDSSFDFIPPKPRGKRRTNAKTSAVILEDLLSESESEEEECDDKNWEPGYNSKQSKKLTSRDEGNREDQSLESENSKIDYPDVTAGGSFFTPPCVTPTKKVLREISDIGQVLSIKLQCKPSTASASASVMESQENQTSILTKKKKVLCNSNTSFFSGCSAITEDK
ncbi:chromosome-associated kinesin KIF4-like isoform X2 [Xenopus laevis]|uniref:Chromosome-associated kinesin KIF4-like isoform X2 n=1 Tax=Xenopus laevis TaxID=8355 RepID=A0A8J1LR21_XENLA|nr:chromosome-associated kinesin KIF4-like isoform X2 [Xenopus laevis]